MIYDVCIHVVIPSTKCSLLGNHVVYSVLWAAGGPGPSTVPPCAEETKDPTRVNPHMKKAMTKLGTRDFMFFYMNVHILYFHGFGWTNGVISRNIKPEPLPIGGKNHGFRCRFSLLTNPFIRYAVVLVGPTGLGICAFFFMRAWRV